MTLPDDFAEALARRAARRLGRTVHYFPAVGSTNDVAAALAASGSAEGAIVLAETQTRGRGRRGRQWHSPAGAGLYVSVVLRPSAPELVTILAADATADAIARATGFEAQIKWPNDLVAPAAAPRLRHRKLAGILAEATSADGRIDVVLGIGVNVGRTAYPPDIGDRATSLEAELGRPVDRGALLGHILDSLESGLDDLREGRRDAILARWLRRAPSACGARVEWEADGGRRHGATAGVDRDGALLVRTVAGLERVVGEVTWLG